MVADRERRRPGAGGPAADPPTTLVDRAVHHDHDHAARRGSDQPVTIAFGGDTHFEGNLASQLASNPDGMFAPIAPTLSGADVAMVNLETAIATGGSPDPKNYNFRAPPSAFEALRAAGRRRRHDGEQPRARLRRRGARRDARGQGADAAGGARHRRRTRPRRTGRGSPTVKGQRLAFFAATDVLDDWLINAWTATDTQPGLASTKGADARPARRRDPGRAPAGRHDRRRTCTGAWRARPARRRASRSSPPQLVAAGADIVVGQPRAPGR